MKDSSGIVVLGMHRSGTSLAAELVQRWGAHGNDHSMLEPDQWNPRGYWEYRPLLEFNDALLRALESSWRVPPWEDEGRIASLAQETAFRVRALELLEEVQRGGGPWFWKDPRLTVLLPFWKQLWGQPAYLIPVRDPGEIAASLKQRDGLSYSSSLLLWQRYMSAILTDPDVASTALFFSYEDLLSDDVRTCRRICEFLDQHFCAQSPVLDERVEFMAGAIAPELRRSRTSIPFAQSDAPTTDQHLLHHALEMKVQGLQPDITGIRCSEASWREHLIAEMFPGSDRCSVNHIQVFWRSAQIEYSESQSRSVPLRDGSIRQSVRISLPAHPTDSLSAIRVDLGNRPGLMFIYGMTIACSSGKVIWAWDRCLESIQAMPQNQVAPCEVQSPEDGCALELVGIDPWIEIALDPAQSDALSGGGSILLDCCYYSAAAMFARLSYALCQLPQLETQTTKLASEQTRSSSRLRELGEVADSLAFSRLPKLETETAILISKQANSSSQLRELEALAESISRQQSQLAAKLEAFVSRADSIDLAGSRISTRLDKVVADVELTKGVVESILHSRTWRVLTNLGGIVLKHTPGLRDRRSA